jgi:hypothetical protein
VTAVALAPTSAHAIAEPADQLGQAARLTDRVHEHAVNRNARILEEIARLKGDKVDSNRRAVLADWTTFHVQSDTARRAKRVRALRREARQARAAQAAAAPAAPAAGGSTASAGLENIAACESGGNPAAVDPSGTYRGKYQFDQQTWQSVGGSGDPAAAPEAEQDARAAQLMAQSGSSPWPVCG